MHPSRIQPRALIPELRGSDRRAAGILKRETATLRVPQGGGEHHPGGTPPRRVTPPRGKTNQAGKTNQPDSLRPNRHPEALEGWRPETSRRTLHTASPRVAIPCSPMATSVDIVVPVLNEEVALPRCIARVSEFIANRPEYAWRITVADNGSTDRTLERATEAQAVNPMVRVTHIEQRGRGRAVKKAWLESDAEVRCYMDVDLSTDLRSLPDLVGAISSGGYDIAIGSRLLPDSEVIGRSLTREITSRGYSALFRGMFWPGFRDAQCGFKAISAAAATALIPLVKNNHWFFDTELLLVARANGYRIRELPVRWEDDPDSRVRVVPTAWEDVKGLLRLRFGGRPRVQRRS